LAARNNNSRHLLGYQALELVNQCGLPNARLPGNKHDLPFAGQRFFKLLAQLRQRFISTHQLAWRCRP
jgi:hypothetical protein